MKQLSFDLEKSRRRCLSYRKKILAISQQVPALHIGPAFSCMETVDTIYHGLMRREGEAFKDTFILSKGHGCMVQYVVLHHLGILADQDLDNFCLPGGRLGAHPDYGLPGIAASTGSLGHGLGLAVGMCYANKLTQQDVDTYVVISDGELQEGSTWEAIFMAANLKLDNLIVFLDFNNRITLEEISYAYPAFKPIADKLKAFHWHVHEIDGHDAAAVFEKGQNRVVGKPTFVVCNTIKGKGVSYMENVAKWHYRSPDAQEYEAALCELSLAESGEVVL